jgi:hypothetical protein
MKINIKHLIPFVFIFLSLNLNSCSDDTLEIVGKVHGFEQNGFTCWYIVDETNGFHYELVSPDHYLLTEGRKVRLTAKHTKEETVCKVGDRVEVVSYRVTS